MNLFSVCPACPFDPKPYDGNRVWGDFDRCPKCGEIMDVLTESGVRNDERRTLALPQAQSRGEA